MFSLHCEIGDQGGEEDLVGVKCREREARKLLCFNQADGVGG